MRRPPAAPAVLHAGRTVVPRGTATTHMRLALQFDGDLGDVPGDAAAALARMALALLQHSTGHDGRTATMRPGCPGPVLDLWLTDPECSLACLCGSGHLPSAAEHADNPPGDVRLALDSDPQDGLRLHWTLSLADESPADVPTVSQQRRPTEAG